MTIVEALILGIVQGLTEFFPVSSSAHLALVRGALQIGKDSLHFDLACHLGSLVSLFWFFRKEIIRILFLDRLQIVYLFCALLPLIPGYFILGPLRQLAADPKLLGLFLIVTGGILFAGDKVRFSRKRGPIRDALLIGAMQSFALIPGVSRSASTISCAQALGWAPRDAVYFSFLLAIPTIIGGNLFEFHNLMKGESLLSSDLLSSLVGFSASLLASLCVIGFAMKWLEKGRLKGFAYYCTLLGIGATVATNLL